MWESLPIDRNQEYRTSLLMPIPINRNHLSPTHDILVRHEGANYQRVKVPSGKLSVHPGSYPGSDGRKVPYFWSAFEEDETR